MAEREIAILEEAVAQGSGRHRRPAAAGGRLRREARYDDAIAQYDEILKTGKEDRAAYLGRGRALELKGELDAAAADYNEVVEAVHGR